MKIVNRNIFSTREELKEIKHILWNYARLPFSSNFIPGDVMERVLGHVRNSTVLSTYDFVDVIDQKNGLGWQVKSTLATTPVTWKRAKLPNRIALIAESEKPTAAVQLLGDAVITFCNQHVQESIQMYDLNEIVYARLIIKDNSATYFERRLCTRENPRVFIPEDFIWRWSTQKMSKKERLSSLHGIHRETGKKWFAWHGRGENQLHFSGESTWWPSADNDYAISWKLPIEQLDLKRFMKILVSKPSINRNLNLNQYEMDV